MRTDTIRTTVLAAIVALVLVACGGGGPADPSSALTDALERTFSGPFRFDLSVELDDRARDALVAEDPQAATVLDGLEVSGAIGDDRFQLLVRVLGVDLFELRKIDARHSYVRVSIAQLAETFGEPLPRDEMLAGLQMFPPELRAAAEALLDGEWVAFVGDPDELASASPMMNLGPDPEQLRADLEESFGDTPAAFAERFAVISEQGSGDDPRTFTVQLRARELARVGVTFMSEAFGGMMMGAMSTPPPDLEADLAEIPELVDGGVVVVSDRFVDEMSVDVLAMARSAAPEGEEVPDGSARLVAAFSDQGRQPDIPTPDAAVELDVAELVETFMQGFLGGAEVTSGFGTAVPAEPSATGVTAEHVRSLAVAQETHFTENGSYTDSLDELFASAGIVAKEGVLYGACLHDGGEAYVIGAASGTGASFFDSVHAEVVALPDDLGCMPPLAPR